MGKTELILFGTKRKIKQYDDYSITCSGQTAKSGKYLGLEISVEIDNVLSGELMTSDIIKKVNSRLKFLYRQAHYFDQKIKKRLCSYDLLWLLTSDIIKKVNSRLKFLYRQAHYFDQKLKKRLFSALILC